MKKLFTLLCMVFSFCSLFGANQTVSKRPYNPDLAWNKNLLEDLSTAKMYVQYGSIIQQGDRIGLIRDKDTAAYAKLNIIIDAITFLKDSTLYNPIDYYYANVYAYAEESKISLSDSIEHKAGTLRSEDWNGTYPSTVGEIKRPKGCRNQNYYFSFYNESATDTLWISNLKFTVSVGDTYTIADTDVTVSDSTMGSVRFTSGTRYVDETVYLYPEAKTGCYFYKWSGINTSSTYLTLKEKPASPIQAVFKAYKGNIKVLNNTNDKLWIWNDGFFKDSIMLSVRCGLKCYDIEWSDGYIGKDRYWSKTGYDTLYVKMINQEATHFLKVNDSKMGEVYGLTEYDVYFGGHDSIPSKTDTIRGSFRRESGKDSIIYLYAKPYPGYRLSHWEDGRSDTMRYANNMNLPCDSSYTFIAYFEKIDTFKIVVLSADTTMGVVSGSGIYTSGETIAKKATAKEGYKLDKWVSLSGNNVNTALKNDTIIAYFSKKTYYVSSSAYYKNQYGWLDSITIGNLIHIKNITTGYEDSSAYPSVKAHYGDTIIITANEDKKHSFIRWEDGNTENPRTVICKGNYYDLYAIFSNSEIIIDTFYIDVVANNRNWGTVSGRGRYAKGDSMHIKATPVDGYLFSHWESVNGLSIDFAQGNDTIIAYFVKDSTIDTIPFIEPVVDSVYFDVRANNIALGSVIGNGWYTKGDTVTIEAIANENAVFEMWSDGVTASKRRMTCYNDSLIAIFSKVAEQTENLVIDNEWVKDPLSSDVLNIFMTIDLSNLSYTEEQRKHLTIQASVEIIKAKGCNATIECYEDATMTKCLGAIILRADMDGISGLVRFAPKPSEGGTFSESCELPENTNYLKFVLEDDEAETFAEIEENFKNMEVALSRKSYELQLAASNDNYGTVYGNGEYLGGDTAIVKAVAAPGYTFVRWSDNEVNPNREIVMSKALSLTAIFDEATTVENIENTANTSVNIYTIEGYTLKRNVKFSEALKDLDKGFYIVNSKKIRIE